MISIDDFKKIELAVGEILSAERVPDTDKLLRLTVNLGEEVPRQIVSGISMYFPEPEKLVGKKCMFVTNLEPRMIKGLESNGMILAVSTDPSADSGQAVKFSLLEPHTDIPAGTKAK